MSRVSHGKVILLAAAPAWLLQPLVALLVLSVAEQRWYLPPNSALGLLADYVGLVLLMTPILIPILAVAYFTLAGATADRRKVFVAQCTALGLTAGILWFLPVAPWNRVGGASGSWHGHSVELVVNYSPTKYAWFEFSSWAFAWSLYAFVVSSIVALLWRRMTRA